MRWAAYSLVFPGWLTVKSPAAAANSQLNCYMCVVARTAGIPGPIVKTRLFFDDFSSLEPI